MTAYIPGAAAHMLEFSIYYDEEGEIAESGL